MSGELDVPLDDAGLPVHDRVRELVRNAPPEYVVHTREDLIGLAEMAAARSDDEQLREWLRAARLVEWEMARRWPVKAKGGGRGDDRPTLRARNVADRVAWQRVYNVGKATVDAILAERDILALYQRAFSDDKDAHVGQNSGEEEWYTPASMIEAARFVLGDIDLDPASTAIANQTVKAARYFTADDDGLDREWHGRVWMNPPYSARLVDQFVYKLLEEFEAGTCPAAIVLTNNSTDTGWWQAMARQSSAVCLPEGRVRFLDPEGKPGAPLQGQAICYLGDSEDLFTDAFEVFGVVL